MRALGGADDSTTKPFPARSASWRFIISFAVVLAAWIAVNSMALLRQPFDPYPYILLNLVLSCLAALQAPVIMMSQNRLEANVRSPAMLRVDQVPQR